MDKAELRAAAELVLALRDDHENEVSHAITMDRHFRGMAPGDAENKMAEMICGLARHILATVPADASDEQMRQDNESLRSEVDRLIQLGRKQAEEIERLNDMADAVEVLRDIGNVIGCGHVDGPDERRQLVNCIEQEFAKVNYELDRKLTVPADDGEPVTVEKLEAWGGVADSLTQSLWTFPDQPFVAVWKSESLAWSVAVWDSGTNKWIPLRSYIKTVGDMRTGLKWLGIELKVRDDAA